MLTIGIPATGLNVVWYDKRIDRQIAVGTRESIDVSFI